MNYFRNIILIVFILLQISISNLGAHPVSNVNLSYDHKQKILNIVMEHHTNDREEDFVRKLEIYKEKENLYQSYFSRQVDLNKVEQLLYLELDPGDKIVIKIYSKKGGIKEIEYIVPDKPMDEQGKK